MSESQASSAGSRVADEDARAADRRRAPVDVDRLTEESLSDRALERAALNVGLSKVDVREIVASHRAELERVPTKLAGELDQARRAARAADATAGRTLRWARVPVWLVRITFVIALGYTLYIAWIYVSWLYQPGYRGSPGSPGISEYQRYVALFVGVLLIPAAKAERAVRARSTRKIYEANQTAREAADLLHAAQAAVQTQRIEQIVRPAIRVAINDRSATEYRTSTSDAIEAEGLAEILDNAYLIPTQARMRLDRFLSDVPGGSIGLSGPRGSGKSSLIHAVCPAGEQQPQGTLGIIVSAPVEFTARDFVLHLFAELCRTIVGRQAVDQLRAPNRLSRESTRDSFTILVWAAPLVLLAGTAMLLTSVLDLAADLVWSVLVLGVGVVLCVILYRTWPSSRRPRPGERWLRWFTVRLGPLSTPRFPEPVIRAATDRLRDIWFQQSFTSGWSGAIKLPVGLEGGVQGGQELARQQMSMPDIVSELRRLVQMVTGDAKNAAHWRVLIGIDELDKIDDPQDAARFLNEIKVLFGIPRCYFLVSISEDAMASFERRGIPMRDVFDSSFDDVIRVSYLDAAESVELLRRRVVGMPIPFMLVCHCLSGGLPRDLIRAARDAVNIRPRDGQAVAVSEVCATLVSSQLTAKAQATMIASRKLPSSGELDALHQLAERLRTSQPASEAAVLGVVDGLLDTMLRQPLSLPELDAGRIAAVALAAELVTFAYFSATLLWWFKNDRAPQDYGAAPQPDVEQPRGPLMVDRLAHAHQSFSLHPRAAWQALRVIRDEAQGERVWPFG